MNKKLQLPLLALMVFMSTLVSGQKILHKANKQFDLKHYHEAIDSYLKTLEKYPENLQAKSNLAEAYRMTNQLTKAEESYAQIMPEEFVDPIHIRNFGITLMKMAKYNKAHYQFELYKVYNPQDAQHYQLSCEFAHHLYRERKAFEVELVGVNTANSDFGVAFNGDQLVFSSFRNDVELSDDAKNVGQKLTGNMLYTASVGNDLRAEDVKFLRSGIAEKKNIGPISFASNSGICAFTRNKIQNGGAHVTGDDSYHSIYVADLKPNGEWNNERPFRYNEFGTSTGFPALAFDGSALYFASNRVGGYGGYDIYVSYWKEGAWTYPENLGDNINTPGNEITPFFTGEDLYFSSDYHHGMGGYDIFHSIVKGGEWTHPENMANGVNSPADDYYPAIKEGTEGIFFSSNRLGGRGMDDIYLAMPVEMPDFASADVMPQAVELTVMSSDVESFSTNPTAKAVANTEMIEVKVLTPNNGDENKNPALSQREIDDIKATDFENEELESWGIVKPGQEDVLLQNERPVITIAPLMLNKFTMVEAMNFEKAFKVLPIQIRYAADGNLLDRSIADMEVEEAATEVELSPEEVAQTIVSESNAESTKVIESTIESEKEVAVVDLSENSLEQPSSYKIPNYEAISAKKAPLNLDLAGAKRVALGEILPTSDVYFIQLAALSKSSGNVDKFKSLARYGNLYKVFKSTSTKIKLGYFLDRSEAQSVLNSVKNYGYKDAFITKDDLVTLQLELIVANDGQSNSFTSYKSNPSANSKGTIQSSGYAPNEYSLNNVPKKNSYKIRLASYEDPIWFDIDKAKQLGKIEQWTKGAWTIFILGGYDSYSEAEKAMIKAVNKGFADAEIVIDNNGILERLKQN